MEKEIVEKEMTVYERAQEFWAHSPDQKARKHSLRLLPMQMVLLYILCKDAVAQTLPTGPAAGLFHLLSKRVGVVGPQVDVGGYRILPRVRRHLPEVPVDIHLTDHELYSLVQMVLEGIRVGGPFAELQPLREAMAEDLPPELRAWVLAVEAGEEGDALDLEEFDEEDVEVDVETKLCHAQVADLDRRLGETLGSWSREVRSQAGGKTPAQEAPPPDDHGAQQGNEGRAP